MTHNSNWNRSKRLAIRPRENARKRSTDQRIRPLRTYAHLISAEYEIVLLEFAVMGNTSAADAARGIARYRCNCNVTPQPRRVPRARAPPPPLPASPRVLSCASICTFIFRNDARAKRADRTHRREIAISSRVIVASAPSVARKHLE